MIIPQFSLRWLLALTAICAAVSLILASAIRGQFWAIGATAALTSVAALAVLYVTAFLGAWLISQMATSVFGRRPAGQSPFATKTQAELMFEASATAPSPMSESPSPITG